MRETLIFQVPFVIPVRITCILCPKSIVAIRTLLHIGCLVIMATNDCYVDENHVQQITLTQTCHVIMCCNNRNVVYLFCVHYIL